MAVVTKYGTGARDPSSLKAIEGVYAAAEGRHIVSQIAVANGDSANSVLYVGELPSSAIVDPDSTIDFTAITGLTSLDLGVYQPIGKGGAVVSAACYMSAKDVSSAGNTSLKAAGLPTTANGHKRVWEIAGLSADPGGNLALGFKMNAAATAAGTINTRIRYLKGA